MRSWPSCLVLFFGLGVLWSIAPQAGRAQIDELPRPDSVHAASFGISVALGDSIAVVGASGEATCGPNGGAVYVYKREPRPKLDEWTGVARLVPRPCREGAFFGGQVALSEGRIFVGASSGQTRLQTGTNAAYVFARTEAGKWKQTERFVSDPERSDGAFAADIDLDGDRAVVTASGRLDGQTNGAVYVYDYDRSAEQWRRSARLTVDREEGEGILGYSVALHGDHLAVSASTYFDRAPGAVYLFRRRAETETWQQTARLGGIESFFIELDLHRSLLLVGEDRAGANNAGRATVYSKQREREWRKIETLRPSLPYDSGAFGTTVSLGRSWALATGYGEQLNKDFNIDRVVYAFRRGGGGTWREDSIVDIGQVDFGAALDHSGTTALVSSVPEGEPGAVYVVQLN